MSFTSFLPASAITLRSSTVGNEAGGGPGAAACTGAAACAGAADCPGAAGGAGACARGGSASRASTGITTSSKESSGARTPRTAGLAQSQIFIRSCSKRSLGGKEDDIGNDWQGNLAE